MSDQPAKRLPRGRSALSPREVERIHRERLGRATADAMAEKGYAATSVEDIIKRAGVSRRAFYHLFGSKLECFLAAFDGARDILIGRVLKGAATEAAIAPGAADDPVNRFGAAISAYLDALAEEIAYARLFLVESYAAGPEAVRRRVAAQDAFTGALAGLLRVKGPAGRLTCAMVTAAVGSMVTVHVAAGDPDAIRALASPVTGHVRRLWELGAFAEPGQTEPGRTEPGRTK